MSTKLLTEKMVINLYNLKLKIIFNYIIWRGQDMKGDVYYGKGIRELEDQYPELYELVSDLNETVWDGKILDYKTQKLIAIGITASRADPRATKKQIKSAIEVLGISKDEIVDVLRVVLLTSGMPAFSKSLQILNSVLETMD